MWWKCNKMNKIFSADPLENLVENCVPSGFFLVVIGSFVFKRECDREEPVWEKDSEEREGQARFTWLCSTEGAFKLPKNSWGAAGESGESGTQRPREMWQALKPNFKKVHSSSLHFGFRCLKILKTPGSLFIRSRSCPKPGRAEERMRLLSAGKGLLFWMSGGHFKGW